MNSERGQYACTAVSGAGKVRLTRRLLDCTRPLRWHVQACRLRRPGPPGHASHGLVPPSLYTRQEGTRDAYFGRLRPVFAYWQAEGIAWDDPPKEVERHVLFYLEQRLGVLVHKDHDLAGYRMELTSQSSIKPSGLRQITSALRDFYRIMAEARFYPYRNPLESPLLKQLRQIRVQAVVKGEIPGNVDDLFIPTATFREKVRRDWQLDPRRSQAHVLVGLSDAIDHLTALPLSSPTRKRLRKQRHHATISRRERAILLLLRTCGPRIGEVCTLTVGGFRSFSENHGAPVSLTIGKGNDAAVLYQALLRNKGGNGRETKEIWMPQETQDALLDYFAHERPLHDPKGSRMLAELDNDEPFFLSEQGRPYSRNAFMKHWYCLHPLVETRCPLHFTVHSIRHLFVTDVLVFARHEKGASSADYLAFKQSFGKDVMHWSDPKTIDVYDHSIDMLETLGLLARYLAARAQVTQAAVRAASVKSSVASAELSPPALQPLNTLMETTTTSAAGYDWYVKRRDRYGDGRS